MELPRTLAATWWHGATQKAGGDLAATEWRLSGDGIKGGGFVPVSRKSSLLHVFVADSPSPSYLCRSSPLFYLRRPLTHILPRSLPVAAIHPIATHSSTITVLESSSSHHG